MSRKDNRRTKSILNKMTANDYNMIIGRYLKRVHNLNFFKRLRFAFNIVVKSKKKKRNLVIKALIFSSVCLFSASLIWLLHFIIFTALIYPILAIF